MNKERIVRAFVDFTDSWNHEIHNAIEKKVENAALQRFSKSTTSTEDVDKETKKMREFYYSRMVNTAVLFMTCISILVSFIALIVAVIAIFTS